MLESGLTSTPPGFSPTLLRFFLALLSTSTPVSTLTQRSVDGGALAALYLYEPRNGAVSNKAEVFFFSLSFFLSFFFERS